MKSRLMLVLVMFLVLAGRAMAQVATLTDELLSAPQVRDFVVLQPTGATLAYQVDGFAPEKFKPLSTGTASFVADNSINLYIQGFNPFVLSVTSTRSESDDTSFASVSKFLDALGGLGKAIGIGPPQGQAVASAADEDPDKAMKDKCEKTLQASLVISTWHQLITAAAAQKTPSCQPSNWDEVKNLFCEAGAAIYDDIDDTSQADTKGRIKKWRDRSTSYGAIFTNDNSGTDAVQKEINDARESLDDRIKKAAAKLDGLTAAILAATKRDPWKPNCSSFDDHTQATATQFVREGNEMLDRSKRLSASLKSLSDMLDKYKDRNLWDQAGTSFRFASVEPSFDKIQTVAVTVNQRKFDDTKEPIEISEVKLSQSTLRIRHHSPFVPEVAAGVAASELRVPKFGTAQKDGKTVVATAGSDYLRTIPSLFFNGIMRFRAESFAYPMFQLGVGTGADRPSFLAGIGLRFTHPRHLAVSAGWAVTWFKDLDKLKLGDEVKGTADVEGDLKLRRSSAEPYLCIQYSF